MIRDKKGSLVDRAYGVAKSRILDADMLPDSFVDEAALAVELGTSKTPVRQALNRLSAEGFIRILPQRGTLVNRITMADIQQVYFLRELLEPAASELAATRATPAQIEQLKELDEQFQSSNETRPDFDLHTRIHVGIAQIAGLPRMTKVISELQDQMHWFLSVRAAEGGPLPPRHRHTDLIEAVKTGDPATARQITEESIRKSRDKIVFASATSGSYGLYSPDTFAWREPSEQGDARR
ncbi:GntR family transcriptional regulator [Zafaria sp. J156]|uniref:GntR family transcriptional regulator n=1 Tax=Zafaria sp. J156 TaxID=3116490 RepID=UPI002E79B32C|nr:GntR family transcriptional regulator [Zafaria sp. J156]MEE1622571.1 GntR family transcriptional regulator [Zafaria sp. J156]